MEVRHCGADNPKNRMLRTNMCHGWKNTDSVTVIKAVEDHFTSLGKEATRSHPKGKEHRQVQTEIEERSEKTLAVPFTQQEIRRTQKGLKNGKTPEDDEITNELLKEGGEEMVIAMHCLMNGIFFKWDGHHQSGIEKMFS